MKDQVDSSPPIGEATEGILDRFRFMLAFASGAHRSPGPEPAQLSRANPVGTIPTLGIKGAALGMCGFTIVAFPLALWYALNKGVLTRRTATELRIAAGALPVVLPVALGVGRL